MTLPESFSRVELLKQRFIVGEELNPRHSQLVSKKVPVADPSILTQLGLLPQAIAEVVRQRDHLLARCEQQLPNAHPLLTASSYILTSNRDRAAGDRARMAAHASIHRRVERPAPPRRHSSRVVRHCAVFPGVRTRVTQAAKRPLQPATRDYESHGNPHTGQLQNALLTEPLLSSRLLPPARRSFMARM